MQRVIPFLVFVLLCGCRDQNANAPLLKLTVKRDNGSSVGQYRVLHTGLIAGSEDGGDDGAVARQSVTVDKIAEDGVTVTVTVLDSETGRSSKQFLVPYDEEITVAISPEATATARLKREE